jgi:hypothetical protein
VFQQENPFSTIRGSEGTEHPGAAAADHYHVVVFLNPFAHPLSMSSSTTYFKGIC